ncbi:uncharacterized protein LOC125868508 [Solanum stenotomum]|uniref:uncharacterized protein LOC125868508 n=1 Tax=Solanum stenotomum TaxID=172797 RepID=UPI0020D1D3EC|nr:uncharacterized protein LOC125868508 [Solanum stenotomum]
MLETRTRKDVHNGLSHQQGKNHQIQAGERAKLQVQAKERTNRRSRGRPRETHIALAAPSESAGTFTERKKISSEIHIAPATSSASANKARGRPSETLGAPAAPPTCPSPGDYPASSFEPLDYHISPISTNSKRGRGRGRGGGYVKHNFIQKTNNH